MKSKKILRMGLCVVMAAALLSACGGKGGATPTPKAESSAPVEETTAPQVTLEEVYGKVTDASMATVTLLTKEGNAYTIAKDDETVVHSGSGIAIDDYVEAVYTGSLADNSAVAKSITVSSETDEIKKICGTVQDAANASLSVLETDGGKTVQIVKTDDTKQTVSNNIGDYVEVTYQEVNEEGYPIALEIK
jgi:hypothetical protein